MVRRPILAEGMETIRKHFSIKREWGGGVLADKIRAVAEKMEADILARKSGL
jgi:hypothetical protein